MITIDVNEEYNFPIEKVWEKITDHEKYKIYGSLKDSFLTKQGIEERNGLGAIRKIIPDENIYFLEEITIFEKYTRFDYFIFETSAPMKHKGGTIKLEKIDSGTKVNWVSTFEMSEDTSPVMQRATKSASSKMFKNILMGIKKSLES